MADGLKLTWKEYSSNTGMGASPIVTVQNGQMVVTRIWDIDADFQAEEGEEPSEDPIEPGDIIKQLLGYPYLNAADNTLRRYLPQYDPEYPDLVATRLIQMQGMRTASNDNETFPEYGHYNRYPRWRATIEFTQPQYWVKSQEEISETPNEPQPGDEFKRYVSVQANAEGDYLHLIQTQGLFKWAEGQTTPAPGIGNEALKPLQEVPGKVVPYTNLIIKWHEVPYFGLPIETIRDYLGTINRYPFGDGRPDQVDPDPADRTRYWRRHSLLFLGASWELKTAADRTYVWDITYQFRENKNLWNFYYNPRAGNTSPPTAPNAPGFYQVTQNGIFYDPLPVDDGGTDLPDNRGTYDERDFRLLFDTSSG